MHRLTDGHAHARFSVICPFLVLLFAIGSMKFCFGHMVPSFRRRLLALFFEMRFVVFCTMGFRLLR
jgi:hypothetical protein